MRCCKRGVARRKRKMGSGVSLGLQTNHFLSRGHYE